MRYATNSFGFRDKPRSAVKSPATYRILLYGDSLIFGWGLNDRERFSDLIEDKLSGLELSNHGVPGWGLDQELVLYEKEGESLQADEVMFFVDANTISRIHTGYIYAKYKPMFSKQGDGRLTLVPVPKGKNAMVSFLYELLNPFYLPYFLQTQIATLQEAARLHAATGGGRIRPSTIKSQRLIDVLSKNLLLMARDTARKRNQQITVLVANLSQADRSDLRDFCNAAEIQYLEIGPDILATSTADDNSDLIFGKDDKHWNAKANMLIAAELLPQIMRGRPPQNLRARVPIPNPSQR